MKKLDGLKILAFCLIFALAINVKLAVAEELDTESSILVKETDNYTFGEIEEILVSYLKSKGNEFEVGSKQYNDFIVEQYINDTDQELVKIADYKAINAYMSDVFCKRNVQRIATKNTECCHPIFSLSSRQCVC